MPKELDHFPIVDSDLDRTIFIAGQAYRHGVPIDHNGREITTRDDSPHWQIADALREKGQITRVHDE